MERVLSFMKIELQLLSLILKSKLSWVKLLLPSSPACACTGKRKDVGWLVCRFTAASQGLKGGSIQGSVLHSFIHTAEQESRKSRQLVCARW
jgi:hypothetical protein